MEIPYIVTARQDTGLWNAKIAIWLFIASEVMLFGGLFSAYVFLRIGADPSHWPHGLLNVPVGTLNTAILITSSITAVLAWASLKMREFSKYKFYMGLTILCGATFLTIKLAYEYPQKFQHFGVFIKQESLIKYEPYLGNAYLATKGLPQRVEITGHLHNKSALTDPDAKEYEIALDALNADPTNPEFDRPRFIQKPVTEKIISIEKEDVEYASVFAPRHSSFFAIYFTITGLHALHVIGGLIVFIYFWLPCGANLYKKDPEHLSNRVEVSCLYWHFVDLVWIFVFPVFYLL
ncbi:MAG: cytochrome c oxidase subunit 3 [Verrucomicrobiota bacterium]